MSGWLERGEAAVKRAKSRPKIHGKTQKYKLEPMEEIQVVFASLPEPIDTHWNRVWINRKAIDQTRKCGGDLCRECLITKAQARAAGHDNWWEADSITTRFYVLVYVLSSTVRKIEKPQEWYMDFIATQHFAFFKRWANEIEGLRATIKKNGEHAQSHLVIESKGAHEDLPCRSILPFVHSHKFCLPPSVLTEAEMRKALDELDRYGETKFAPLKVVTESKAKSNGHHKMAGATA